MQTSYFAAWRGKRDPRLVAISLGVPTGYRGHRWGELAPTQRMLNEYKSGRWSWHAYTVEYQVQVLGKLRAGRIIRELGEDAILLCWEKPGEPCHRRLVAEWIEFETGLVVPEWTPESVPTTAKLL